jgi:site-specific recombinase XerD
LTLEELMTLLNFKFESPKRARARDLFCFMCFTGMRVSDLRNLKKENIKDGQIFKMIKDITGHKKDSVFNKYVKISEEFKTLEMDRTWDKISIPPKMKS